MSPDATARQVEPMEHTIGVGIAVWKTAALADLPHSLQAWAK